MHYRYLATTLLLHFHLMGWINAIRWWAAGYRGASAPISWSRLQFLRCLSSAGHKWPWQDHIHLYIQKNIIIYISLAYLYSVSCITLLDGRTNSWCLPCRYVCMWDHKYLTNIKGSTSCKAEGKLQKPSCSFSQRGLSLILPVSDTGVFLSVCRGSCLLV